ncbi:DUF5906 domain-containing protein [Cobetia sp. 10Alg 146]|uniref:primase-helicase family protein n=1 Tax=Cobetia sp. 10Alg 146 TaxID=3040019 RepID=UPI00244D357D|nr:primase-helicase family protein [Cobetia sp. 10Alg 146]MDH2290023.1 DUF5906 domain-containing protein [Cobetia sp. 10Alg 146]
MDQFPATFVNAQVHLGKTYTLEGRQNPPHAKNLTSIEYPLTADFEGLDTLAKLIARHSGGGDAFFTGHFPTPLANESRAGRSDPKFRPQILVIDIDDMPLGNMDLPRPLGKEALTAAANRARDYLPDSLRNTACVAHASSSFGMKPKTASLHLFFLLDAPVVPGKLKAWLTEANFAHPDLDAQIELNPSGQSLHFTLDRCTADNSRLIYIATPLFLGELIRDPFTSPQERVALIPGETPVANVSKEINAVVPQTADNLIKQKVKELRALAQLPSRVGKTKVIETRKGHYHELLTNPDTVSIEIAYENDPFVYANLNGGDSNAYYWPKDNPKYIYNFKDEPVVEMVKVAPDFYRDYMASISDEVVDETVSPLVFRDRDADTYSTVLYNTEDSTLVHHAYASRVALRDFMLQYGADLPDPIESWQVSFDPKSTTGQIDSTNKHFNLFRPSPYMMRKPEISEEFQGVQYGYAAGYLNQVAPNIHKLIDHVVGHGQAEYEHFINWLAFAFVYREKTSVAWMFHGVEGTGKGLLFHQIIKPLFTERYSSLKKIFDLEDNYDGWREQMLLVVIDEFRMADAKEGSRMYEKLKNMISETSGSVRHMRSNQKNVELFENMIFFSNTRDALKISATDRRFCVAPAQNTPINALYDTAKLIFAITQELPQFADFLTTFKIDKAFARIPLQTEAKAAMRNASNTWVDDYVDALRGGDFEWLINNVLDVRPTQPDDAVRLSQASEVLARLAIDILEAGESRDFLNLDDALILYNALAGDVTRKLSFSKMMARYGLNFERRRIAGQRIRVAPVAWEINEDVDLMALIRDNGTPAQQKSLSSIQTH